MKVGKRHFDMTLSGTDVFDIDTCCRFYVVRKRRHTLGATHQVMRRPPY